MIIHYAGINYNDVVNGANGISVSYFTQGCHYHCEGCHNPETWDIDGGLVDSDENIINNIINGISANGIMRNLSILGGEPLGPYNIDFVDTLVDKVREKYPDILIFVWTGNSFENLINVEKTRQFLHKVDYLIDGRFHLEERDITLFLRGSSNQRVIDLKESFKGELSIVTVDKL